MNRGASMTEAASKPDEPRLRLRLTPRAETIVRSGHPWVFSDSVRSENRPGHTGELAVIFDRNDRFLAIGFYDADSPIRVRILHAGKPVTLDAAWWTRRFEAALQRRQGLFGPETDGYRLIHGESDGFPGLVLDRYGAVAVLKVYSAAWLPRLPELVGTIRENLAPGRLVLRLSRNIQAAAERGWSRREGDLIGTGEGRADTVLFREHGLVFEADVVHGQKTGFFLDQRDNRQRVGEIAEGRDVLNAFSFTGGFSVHAAKGGAARVTDLDISRHALAGAARNFALNASVPAVAAAAHEGIQADCFEWLARGPRREFDLIVVDPPSLARRESERQGAIAAYRDLNASAIRRLRPGGVLVAASCSAHVTEDEFFAAVREVAGRSGRSWTLLWSAGHPADHPATFPEARYLKCLGLRFGRASDSPRRPRNSG